MDVRELPGAPRSPLILEIFVGAIQNIMEDKEITEVQRQVITEWIEYARSVNLAISGILLHWDARLNASP
jgi:hypothetical protein